MNLKFLPLLLALSLITCCIGVDISVPGFPEMSQYFNVSEGIIQLTIAYNFLGFCISALFYGPLSESFGRRAVMVIGNALLTLGAIGCVYAESISFLLASRFTQGLGAATSAVVAFAVVADVYKGHASVRVIGLMNSIITVIMAIAPVAGAFINRAIGFRGNYACVAIISVISWILIFTFLPETKKERDKFSLKKVLNDYKKLLCSSEFMSTSAAPSLTFCAYMSFIAAAPFLYMNTFGLSIVSYAIHQGVIVGTFAVVSLLSGKIMAKFVGLMSYLYDGTAITVSLVVLLANTLALVFIIKILHFSRNKGDLTS